MPSFCKVPRGARAKALRPPSTSKNLRMEWAARLAIYGDLHDRHFGLSQPSHQQAMLAGSERYDHEPVSPLHCASQLVVNYMFLLFEPAVHTGMSRTIDVHPLPWPMLGDTFESEVVHHQIHFAFT